MAGIVCVCVFCAFLQALVLTRVFSLSFYFFFTVMLLAYLPASSPANNASTLPALPSASLRPVNKTKQNKKPRL